MMDTHEENVDEEIVEEDMFAPTDFSRIRTQYSAVFDRVFDGEDEDGNPAGEDEDEIPVRLNFFGPTIRDIPAEAFHKFFTLTDLRVIPTGGERFRLRTIGTDAFRRCSGLRRINQFLKESGVLRLEDGVFESCFFIEGQLIIPGSVLYVGICCFGECESITSVVFEPSSTGTVVIEFDAFNDCTELSSATLPPTLECIPWSCFNRCTALVHVPIPPTVVELERESFAMCTSLPSMELPESVEVIGDETFLDCTALTTVTIRTTSFDLRIGDNVFGGCTALTTIWTYPWHWGKLLSSMENDANFLNNFFNGTLTPLHQIDLTSWYGPLFLEAVKDQPSVLYRVLRAFQTNNDYGTTNIYWGKLLSSMEDDANFLNSFFNGTLTPLHQIDLTSRYGARILEAVNEQPSLLYRVLRKFQHQRFETTTERG